MPDLSSAELDFGVRDSNSALRSLVKSLGAVPGRKTLVLLTAGYPVTPELMPEVESVIDVCNKANVAIYPVDVQMCIRDSIKDIPFDLHTQFFKTTDVDAKLSVLAHIDLKHLRFRKVEGLSLIHI